MTGLSLRVTASPLCDCLALLLHCIQCIHCSVQHDITTCSVKKAMLVKFPNAAMRCSVFLFVVKSDGEVKYYMKLQTTFICILTWQISFPQVWVHLKAFMAYTIVFQIAKWHVLCIHTAVCDPPIDLSNTQTFSHSPVTLCMIGLDVRI